MNNTYNDKMYLKTSDLNNIENRIESLTNEIQEKVFNNQSSPLRNINIGDNLNGKTLYIYFPRTLYNNVPSDDVTIVSTDKGNSIRFHRYASSSIIYLIVELFYKNNSYTIYSKYTSESDVRYNVRKYKLPYDFGIVNAIDENNIFYPYIKIYNDEMIMPDYEKHIWVDNEVLSMQKIDNIECGVKNIGYYYYKPKGWINGEEWLKTSNIEIQDTNINKKNLYYQDLNRWLTDISSIDFEKLNEMTIWNSNISQILYNTENAQEWEEL